MVLPTISYRWGTGTVCQRDPKRQPFEPRHDTTNKVTVRPAKTQISLGIRPVWSESSLSAWRNLGSLATHWAHSEDSDQTGRIPRLVWIFAGRTLILLVLSWGGSFSLRIRLTRLCKLWSSVIILKQYKWAATWHNQQNECAPSEDSDQPGHWTLYLVFCVSR